MLRVNLRSKLYDRLMSDSSDRANRELLVLIGATLRDLTGRLDDLTVLSFAIVRALAEREEGFADVYLAHKEATEAGEMGQKTASKDK